MLDCVFLDEGAEGGEVSSSKALLESQEAEGKSNNSWYLRTARLMNPIDTLCRVFLCYLFWSVVATATAQERLLWYTYI